MTNFKFQIQSLSDDAILQLSLSHGFFFMTKHRFCAMFNNNNDYKNNFENINVEPYTIIITIKKAADSSYFLY